MSNEPVYIKLFLDDLDALEELSDTEKGRLLTALLKYGRSGEAPRLTGNERILFPMFRARVDRDFAIWREKSDNLHEARAEAGRKGGQARASKDKQGQANPSNASKGKQGQAKQAYDHNHDHDYDYDHDHEQRLPTPTPLPPTGRVAVVAVENDSVFSRLFSEYLAYCPETPEKKLAEYCRLLSPEVCFRALEAAQDAGRHDWKYLNGILRKREEWGVRSLEDWDKADAEWKRSYQTGFNGDSAASAQNAGIPEQSADERWGIHSAF